MISWTKRPIFRRSVAAAVVLICAVVAYSGVANLLEAKAQLAELRSTTRQLAKESQGLYRVVIRLRSEREAVERACRRDMGMVRPDEVVYQAGTPAGPGQ